MKQESAPVYRAIGARIQMCREMLGVTQVELAKRVNYERTSITNIELGNQQLPMHKFEEIAKALGATPRSLLKGIWT